MPGESVGIETRLVALAAWMKESYGGTMIQALKTVLPHQEKGAGEGEEDAGPSRLPGRGGEEIKVVSEEESEARARLLEALLSSPRLDYDLAREKLNITPPVVRALEEEWTSPHRVLPGVPESGAGREESGKTDRVHDRAGGGHPEIFRGL